MIQLIRNWFNNRIIKRSMVTQAEWGQAFASLPLLVGYTAKNKRMLKNLAILFLHRKIFEGADGLVVTQEMGLVIALQACIPILKMDINAYDGWVSIIVYPVGFSPKREVMDEFGVRHTVQSHLAGEAWQRGPVVLAWDETAHAGVIDGHNLVIHEFAHKLDMQTGSANGFPPLHSGMSSTTWFDVFMRDFADFQHRCKQSKHSDIDCYGATSPAEFFAVLSEVFFERPDVIKKHYADVYTQLKLYYRQDPLLRLQNL